MSSFNQNNTLVIRLMIIIMVEQWTLGWIEWQLHINWLWLCTATYTQNTRKLKVGDKKTDTQSGCWASVYMHGLGIESKWFVFWAVVVDPGLMEQWSRRQLHDGSGKRCGKQKWIKGKWIDGVVRCQQPGDKIMESAKNFRSKDNDSRDLSVLPDLGTGTTT